MKKTITFIALILTVLALTLTMVACVETGAQGEQGIQGEDGHSPEITIGTNGNWFIDGVDTGVSAKGAQGETGTVGPQGPQGIQGIQGEDGHSPEITIGTNGNWFIDGVDTGVSAKGAQGEVGTIGPQGPKGDDGQPGKDGTSLLTGNGIPMEILGKEGDSYIDLDTFDFYIKNATEWVFSGNIKGSDATVAPDYNGSIGLAFFPLNDTECAVSVGNAKYLEEIVIPETYKGLRVVSILEEGFSECENLKKITIPDTITSIGFKAFYHCNSLTSLTLPFVGETKNGAENTHLGYIFGAKHYTESNQTDLIPQSLREVVVTGGTIDDHAFYYYQFLTKIVLPDGIESIGDNAFYHCSDLTSIEIPGSVKTIGKNAFEGCYDLTKVDMSDGLIEIGAAAFSQCQNLTSIVIPDSVTTIGNKAFGECSRLTDVTIGSGVKTIGARVFDYCNKLANIYYIGTEEQWASITTHENNEYLFNATIYCNGTTIACKHKYDNDCDADCNVCGVVRTPAEHVYDNDSDADCNVCGAIDENRSIVNGTWGGLTWALNKISGKLVISGTGAMDDFSGIPEDAWREYVDVIKSVTIENGVTSIGNYAFINCRRLTSITIHEGITTIGTGAFLNCTSLVEVYNYSSLNIRKGTIDFGNIACYAIDVYTTNESSKLTTDENGFVIHVDGEEKTLVCYVGTETEIVIPSSVTAIKNDAFFNCNSITSVTFGENSQLTTIGEMAFADCNGLTSIIIPSNVTTIGRGAFGACDNLLNVIISQSVTAIGMDAFYGCNKLTDVYYMGTEEQWNAIDIYIDATIHFNYVPE